jgi:hypothetical protein
LNEVSEIEAEVNKSSTIPVACEVVPKVDYARTVLDLQEKLSRVNLQSGAAAKPTEATIKGSRSLTKNRP